MDWDMQHYNRDPGSNPKPETIESALGVPEAIPEEEPKTEETTENKDNKETKTPNMAKGDSKKDKGGASSSDTDEETPLNDLKVDLKADHTGDHIPNHPKTPVEQVRIILAAEEDDDNDTHHIDLSEFDLGHALFCQMDVLCHFEDGKMGWKESARWLKYEEKLDVANRWSKPHVATTSMHAIQSVKKGIENDTVILNLQAPHGCLHQVAEKISRQVAKDKNFTPEQQQLLKDILLKPHKHQHRTGITNDATKAKIERFKSLPLKEKAKENNRKDSQEDTIDLKKEKEKRIERLKKLPKTETEVSALYHTYPGGVLPEQLKPYKPNKKIMKKIPGGSEVASILIGQVGFLTEPIMIFARLIYSNVLRDLTEVAIPTRFIFLHLGPSNSTSIWEMIENGRAMAALLNDRIFCELAYKSSTKEDLIAGIEEYIDDLTVLPPSIWDPSTRLEPPETTISDDKIRNRLMESARHAEGPEAYHFAESAEGDPTLRRTGKLFGGLFQDIKRRYPHMLSDYKDGFNIQCLAAVIFLYFACITPIVTFGGMLGKATGEYMGAMECLLSGAICGLIYHIFAGQPLTIVGATGPLLVFEGIVYQVTKQFELDFLAFRFWIAIWITVILLFIVAFDLSSLVRYITRFTEESFGVLISLIFVVEAFKKLAHIWDTHPIHIHALHENQTYKCHCEHPPDYGQNGTDTGQNGTDSGGVFNTTMPYMLPNNDSASGNSSDFRVQDHPIFEIFNWSSLVYEDCITYQHRLVVDASCITEKDCNDHGWNLVGPACNVHSVTHSVPDVFFLCCFLFIGTFVIAYAFRMFRTSSFFPSITRSTFADFSVLIAILFCTGIDYAIDLDTPKLLVPAEFKNTRPDLRRWLVNPMDIGDKWWVIFIAVIPALLATILIFLDQQITAVIVNRKEHKLVKGHGYHLDLLILSILIAICGVLGLPWFVAATVRSITHVRALIRESELRAPGERPQFLGVREQRLTGVAIHILIGLSVLMTSILKHIPMAVLYGVFLYMGVTSLSGVQFVDRILLLIMPKKYQPDFVYLRHVEITRVHIFTLIQIGGMVIMWTCKSIKMISILFPLMILALCFIRKGLECYFTQNEMYFLDHLLPEKDIRKKEDEENVDRDYLEKKFNLFDPLEKFRAEGEHVDSRSSVDSGSQGYLQRGRRQSMDIINRFRDQHQPKSGDDSKSPSKHDVNDGEKALYDEPFRQRQFSF